MEKKNIMDLFPNKIIKLLGGKQVFETYPIIENPYKTSNSISVGVINECPFFVMRIKYRNKEYKEVFKQKSINNKELWECSSHSYIFSKNKYNFYYPNSDELSDLKNIESLINNINIVYIYNFTNGLGPRYNFFNEEASLV